MKDIKWLCYLIAIINILFYTSCTRAVDLAIIKFPCFINENGRRWNIESMVIYKQGKLKEYQGCASEGLYTLDVHDYDADLYNKNPWYKKYLKVHKEHNVVIYFDETYLIVREGHDSVFTKSKTREEYLLFVGKIPTEKE